MPTRQLKRVAEIPYGIVEQLHRELHRRISAEDAWKLQEDPGLWNVMLSAMRAHLARRSELIVSSPADEAVEQVQPTPPVVAEELFFLPLADASVPEAYRETVAKYRVLATEHEVPANAPVCYRVRAGFTLKKHAPKAGPCRENFQYLQGWNFKDEPTVDSLVFWVPRILRNSTSKTVSQQKELLSLTRTRFSLPAHHMSGFGQAGLVVGLILAHFKATDERVPENQLWARTDICSADGFRLYLGDFCASGLSCNCWNWDTDADDNLGVCALGVETLGS